MPNFMIKVAGEGAIQKAHRLADPGPTSGSSIVYDVQNVPEGTSVDDVIAAFKTHKGKPPHNDAYEVDFGAL